MLSIPTETSRHILHSSFFTPWLLIHFSYLSHQLLSVSSKVQIVTATTNSFFYNIYFLHCFYFLLSLSCLPLPFFRYRGVPDSSSVFGSCQGHGLGHVRMRPFLRQTVSVLLCFVKLLTIH
jgi:hypothetical protein